jgi:glycine/D-amino acid oxidase-like deaminating enzyme
MVVLDMGDPASGASGRNAGEVVMGRYFAMVYSTVQEYLPRLRPDLCPESIARLARQFAAVYCRAAYKNADMIEKAVREEGLDCDYAREGWVQERSGSEQTILDETVRMGRENGFADWDRLSAEEATQKSGANVKLPANVSRKAGRFHPAKWVWALFGNALQSSSVQLFAQTKVLSIQDDGDAYRVITVRGTIRARHVVNATEAYTPNLHKNFRNVIAPRQTQAAYGLDEGRSLKSNVSFSNSTLFCVRHRNGILFGSDETPIPWTEVGNNRPSRFITAHVAAELRRSFGRFPLRITNEWAGSVGFTPDEYPIVGVFDGKRQYIIGGMSGSGTAVSFNAGRCVCHRILGYVDADDYPIEYFGPSRLLDPGNHPWPNLDST